MRWFVACRSCGFQRNRDGIVFFPLDDFDKRTGKELSARAIAAELTKKLAPNPMHS